MKKTICLILALLLCVSLCACGEPAATTGQPGGGSQQTKPQGSKPAEPDKTPTTQTPTQTPTPPATQAPPVNTYSEGLEYYLMDSGTYTVRSIGSCADTHIVIPATYEGVAVTAISTGAFRYQWNLTGITLPDSITYIGNRAFEGCSKVREFTLPAGITELEDGALGELIGLETIRVSKDNTAFYIENNCLIQRSNGKLVKAAKGAAIPTDGSIKSIGRSAFSNAGWLTEVTIPSGVTVCDAFAFQSCTNLTSVVFEEGCTSVGYGAFQDCTALIQLTLPATMENIGDVAFYGCSALTTVAIPEGVKILCGGFGDCAALTTIYLPASLEYLETSLVCSEGAPITLYYAGTQAQWDQLMAGNDVQYMLNHFGNATVICSDGTLTYTPATEG